MTGAFCRACGLGTGPGATTCDHCGWPLVGPASGAGDPRGVELSVKAGLWKRETVYVAAVAPPVLSVIGHDGNRREISLADTKQLAPDRERSASVRVLQLLADELVEPVRAALNDLLDTDLLPDIAQSRAVAQLALLRLDPALLARTKLGDREKEWLAGHLAWRMNERDVAARHFVRLPPGTYPDVDPILAALAPLFTGDTGTRSLAIARAKASQDPGWASALAIATQAVQPDLVWVISAAGSLARLPPPDAMRVNADRARRLVTIAARLGGGDANPSDVAVVELAAMLRSGRIEPDLRVDSTLLATLPAEVVDDLIDAGVDLAAAASESAQESLREHVVARTQPADLTDEQVANLGFDRERLRRSGLDGDLTALREYQTVGDVELECLAALASGSTAKVDDLARYYTDHGAEPRRLRLLDVAGSMSRGSIDPAAVADRSSWPLLEELLPPPQEWPTLTPPVQRLAAWSVLHSSVDALWAGRWSDAAEAARNALRVSSIERTRDEALNVLAYACWMEGNDDGARAALTEAVDSGRTANLQVNYALVVGESVDDDDKYTASVQLAELANESPNLEQGVRAIQRALALWNEIPPGTEVGDSPPPELVAAARRLANEPTARDSHNKIMSFLAWADDDWLSDAEHTNPSRWSSTLQHRYYCARASSFGDAIETLQASSKEELPTEDCAWAAEEAEEVGRAVFGVMLNNLDEPLIGPALCGLQLSDAHLIRDEALAVKLELLSATTGAAYVATQDDGCPSRSLWDHMENAIVFSETSDTAQDELDQDFIDANVHRYAFLAWDGWARLHDSILAAMNGMFGQLSGLRASQINRGAVRRSAGEMRATIDDLDGDIAAVLRRVTDVQLFTDLNRLRSSLSDMRSRLAALG